MDVKLSADELAKRARPMEAARDRFRSGYVWKYAQLVGEPKRRGHASGRRAEKECYADI